MSRTYYNFTLHHGLSLSESEMREIATQICKIAVERRMGFTVEEVCVAGQSADSERTLTYEEIWGED